MPVHSHLFPRAILTCNVPVGQTDLVLAYNQGSLVGLCTSDYKFLYAVVMIYSTLVDIQTHIRTYKDRQHLTSLHENFSQLS